MSPAAAASVIFGHEFRALYASSLLFGWGAFYEISSLVVFLVTLAVGFAIAAILGGGSAPYRYAGGILLASGLGSLHLWMGRVLVSWSLVFSPPRCTLAVNKTPQSETGTPLAADSHSSRLPMDATAGTILLTIAVILMLVTIHPNLTDELRVLPIVIPAISATIVVQLWRAGYRNNSRAHQLAAKIIAEIVAITVVLRTLQAMSGATAVATTVFAILFCTVQSAVVTLLVHRIPQ